MNESLGGSGDEAPLELRAFNIRQVQWLGREEVRERGGTVFRLGWFGLALGIFAWLLDVATAAVA